MRGALRLRPVNSYKNVVDTAGSLAAASVSVTTIAVAVNLGVQVSTSNHVPVGGRISAIYYSLYLASDALETISTLMDIYWWKKQADILTPPTPGGTGASESKRWVFHEEKGLAGNRTTGSMMVVKGVLKIPKSYQRFGIDDKVEMRIFAPVNGLFCSKHIYRVFY